ncbi:hypothetical protein [Xylophilus sp.]|uniref:hypothetical protein n=1 Tax=Xylophilus sp. TaxID=2653893 RepID=UPI0013BAAD14|nr:hypothetical protein [Xylophilus sp.]KAF1048696.1 MAG: hypothetical protein GAK38_01140 [Xylophilus sp.]
MSAQEIFELQRLEYVLDTSGIQGALRFLNGRTPHRCTAIYRLRGLQLQSLYLFDRLGERHAQHTVSRLDDSFCLHAAGSGPPPAGEPAPGWPASYYSLPLSRRPGDLFGTLCHFDYEPRLVLPDTELSFLQRAAHVLVPHLTLQ